MKADNNSKLVKEWTERSKVYIDIIHNIQLRRIGLGFSHADLSFLLGRPYDYVYNIETFLNDKEYYLSDLVRLYDIFKCTPKELFDNEEDKEPHYRGNTGVYQYWDDKAIKQHEIYLIENFKPRLVYQVSEKISPVKELKALKSALILEIRNLIVESYFEEGAEPMIIFNTCKDRLKNNFRPIHLEAALHYFVKTIDPPLLEIIKEKEDLIHNTYFRRYLQVK